MGQSCKKGIPNLISLFNLEMVIDQSQKFQAQANSNSSKPKLNNSCLQAIWVSPRYLGIVDVSLNSKLFLLASLVSQQQTNANTTTSEPLEPLESQG